MRTANDVERDCAAEMKEALRECLRELSRAGLTGNAAYLKASLAYSRASGMLSRMEDEEVYGVIV